MSVLCWGHSRKREQSFLCNTASTFSHFRFPPTNSMWWAFPPLVKSTFQHLAGVFRRWFPFPDNPVRGKAFEQCFWQWEGSRQSPPHHPLVEEAAYPSPYPRDQLQAIPWIRQCQPSKGCPPVPTSAARLWADCVLRMAQRRDDGMLSFMLSMCFRSAGGYRRMNISSVRSHSQHPDLCGGTWHCREGEMGKRKEAQVAMPNANENRTQRNNTQSIYCPSFLGTVLQCACLWGGKIVVTSSLLLALSFQRNN